MPLQIRRGPTADRLSIVPLLGELVYDTNTGAVFIGDGITAGGVPITELSAEDVRNITAGQFLGSFIDDNTVHTGITFQYVDNRLIATVSDSLSGNFSGNFLSEDSTLIIDGRTGTVYGNFVGNVWADDSTGPLINGANGSINLDGTVKGDIVPDQNETYDIGSSVNRFKDLYLSGSSLWLGGAQLTSIGQTLILPSGSTIDGNPLGFELGQEYAIDIRGDLRGSVFPDDSTAPTNFEDPDDSTRTRPLVDATEGSINLDGTVKGNVIPDQTETRNRGSLIKRFNKLYLTESNSSLWIGNAAIGATGTAIDLPAGSTVGGIAIGGGTGDGVVEGSNYKINIVAADSSLIVDSDNNQLTGNLIGNVSGNLIGDVSGNLTGSVFGPVFGNLIGDVRGSVFSDDSALLVDATNGSIPYSVLSGAPTNVGQFTNDTGYLTLLDLTDGLAQLTLASVIANTVSLNSNTSSRTPISISYHGDDTLSAIINYRKFRGTPSVPTVISPGDEIFRITGQGYDGTNSVPVAAIIGFADSTGTIGPNVIPGKLEFYTTDTAGVSQKRIEIDKDGDVIVYGELYNNLLYINSKFDKPASMIITHASDLTNGSFTLVQRSRGTDLSPLAVTPGDEIGAISYRGYTGTQFSSSVAISAFADPTGTITSSAVPGQLKIATANASGTLIDRLILDKDGLLQQFGQHYTITSTPTGLPRLLLANTSTVSAGARSGMRRSRGTFAAPTSVLDNDVLFRLMWGGYDGTSYLDTASIEGVVNGVVSTGVIPTKLDIRTTNSIGTLVTAATVTSEQTVEAFGAIKFATYANPTARDTKFTVSLVQAGMVVFLTDSTGSGGPPKLQVNTDGTQLGWVDLH